MPRASRSRASRALACAGLAAWALLAAGCAGDVRWPTIDTQRYPGPMPARVEPLPPGTEAFFRPGPEEVLVVRHADPVQVRPAGGLSAFPMTFLEKSLRVNAGSWVYTLPGGRAEILWPNGSTVALFGRCAVVVGSQSRGEPAVFFYEVERANLSFVELDQVRLVGGSMLSLESGPFVLERLDEDLLRLRNQSKRAARLAFRQEEFALYPGEVIQVPLLEAGGAPVPVPAGGRQVPGPGFDVLVHGAVEVVPDPGGVSLRAEGEHRIEGLGLRLELLPGESVRFVGLRVPPPPAALPAPGETAPVPPGLEPPDEPTGGLAPELPPALRAGPPPLLPRPEPEAAGEGAVPPPEGAAQTPPAIPEPDPSPAPPEAAEPSPGAGADPPAPAPDPSGPPAADAPPEDPPAAGPDGAPDTPTGGPPA